MRDGTESDLYLLAWQRIKQLTNAELLCFVRSKNTLARNLAIQEFHMRPSHEALQTAVALTTEKEAIARASGYLILGQLGSPNRPFREDSMPAILHGLALEKYPSVQCAIACAIGHLAPPMPLHETIIQGLSRFLDNKRKSMRVAVAFAVAGLSMSNQLDHLMEKLLIDNDQDVKEWIDMSLQTIRSRTGETAKSQDTGQCY